MSKARCIKIEMDPRVAAKAGVWLVAWRPPNATVLGGPIAGDVAPRMGALGYTLSKIGRSKRGRRIVELDRDLVQAFVDQLYPCLGSFRLWPPVVLNLRQDLECKLKQGRGRRSHDLVTLRRVSSPGYSYADDRHMRRLRSRLRRIEAATEAESAERIEFGKRGREWLIHIRAIKTP